MNADESPILACWQFVADGESEAMVLPDGCRDLILRETPGERLKFMASPLDGYPRRVRTHVGESFRGIRLQPGVVVDESCLRKLTAQEAERLVREGLDVERIVHRDERVCTALQAIAAVSANTGASLDDVARSLGVSLRSLQRLVGQATGHSPRWWRRLARARQAARQIVDNSDGHSEYSLIEVALAAGYADQSHLTRELKVWFHATPAALCRVAAVTDQLKSPGYATERR